MLTADFEAAIAMFADDAVTILKLAEKGILARADVTTNTDRRQAYKQASRDIKEMREIIERSKLYD
jgi:peroxiredoxin